MLENYVYLNYNKVFGGQEISKIKSLFETFWCHVYSVNSVVVYIASKPLQTKISDQTKDHINPF